MKPSYDPNDEEETTTQSQREARWRNQSLQYRVRSEAAQLAKGSDNETETESSTNKGVKTSTTAETNVTQVNSNSQKHLPGRHDQRKHGRDQGGGSGGGGGAGGSGGGGGGADGDEGSSRAAAPKKIGKLDPLPGAPKLKNGNRGPDPRLVAVAEDYAKRNGIDFKRQAEYVKVDETRAKQIADAYEQMKDDPRDPAVREAYQDLIDQTTAQYRALDENGYKFWFYDPADSPYSIPTDALHDLRTNQRMGVFPTEAGYGSAESAEKLDVDANPMLADTGIQWSYGSPDGPKKRVLANDLFRAVHDAFGHGLEGSGFRARGEENAWQAHVRLFRGPAVAAITSETRGQNSWVNYGPFAERNQTASQEDTVYAPQKVGVMPSWTWMLGRAGDMEDETKHVRLWENVKHYGEVEGIKQARQVIDHFGPGNEHKALIYLQQEIQKAAKSVLHAQNDDNTSSVKFSGFNKEQLAVVKNAVNAGRYEGMRQYYNAIIKSIHD